MTAIKELLTLPILIISFGFKSVGSTGIPKADLYLDCRSIPNPHHSKEVGHLSGSDPKMVAWIKEHGQGIVEVFRDQIKVALNQIPSRRRGEEDMYTKPFIIACGCAYGVHRSVAIKHLLIELLTKDGLTVSKGD